MELETLPLNHDMKRVQCPLDQISRPKEQSDLDVQERI